MRKSEVIRLYHAAQYMWYDLRLSNRLFAFSLDGFTNEPPHKAHLHGNEGFAPAPSL